MIHRSTSSPISKLLSFQNGSAIYGYVRNFYFIVAIIGIILPNISRAQSQNQDYIITLKGDTVVCKITTPLFGGNKYRTDSMPDNKKLKADEIKEYYIARKGNRQRAVLTIDASAPVFMKVIENGVINLYEVVINRNYGNNMYSSTTNWYVNKGNGVAIPLKTSSLWLGKSRKERKDEFGEMIKDKKEVYDKYIADNSFSFDQIQALIKYYNTGVFTPPNQGDSEF